jgi:hypothetical protein
LARVKAAVEAAVISKRAAAVACNPAVAVVGIPIPQIWVSVTVVIWEAVETEIATMQAVSAVVGHMAATLLILDIDIIALVDLADTMVEPAMDSAMDASVERVLAQS